MGWRRFLLLRNGFINDNFIQNEEIQDVKTGEGNFMKIFLIYLC